MTARLDWSTWLHGFDRDRAEDAIERWLISDGIDILSALPLTHPRDRRFS